MAHIHTRLYATLLTTNGEMNLIYKKFYRMVETFTLNLKIESGEMSLVLVSILGVCVIILKMAYHSDPRMGDVSIRNKVHIWRYSQFSGVTTGQVSCYQVRLLHFHTPLT